jgi:dihydropteroate synthase
LTLTASLRCRQRVIALDRPVVMGVLNVTPDSFSDGGRYADPQAALTEARQMVAQGATIIDVGGESTRPGSQVPSLETELARVVPVVQLLATELDVAISVDTSRAEVIDAAVQAGAVLINDVRGLSDSSALAAAARLGVGVCVMHMQGQPSTMQTAPSYTDVVSEVRAWLQARLERCVQAGIAADALLVDPGFGFGKTLEHNLALLNALEEFALLGAPLLVGLSRKSLAGTLTGRAVADRLAGSVALAALAVSRGASIVRAHDVGPTVDAIKIGSAARRDRWRQQ